MRKINGLLLFFLIVSVVLLGLLGIPAGILSRILENTISSIISAIIVVNVVNRIVQIEEERRIMKTQRVAIGMLMKAINEFLLLTAQQIKAASNKWLPKNLDEMYSDESLLIIGLHLDISKTAPIPPRESWRDYISRKTTEFLEAIDSALKFHAFYLSNELISALDKVHSSPILYLYKILPSINLMNIQWKTTRPPKIGLLPHGYGIFWKDIKNLIRVVEAEQDMIVKKDTFQTKVEIRFPFDILSATNMTPRLGNDRIE